MRLLAILEEKGLFVPQQKILKPQDNGFKKRNGE